MLKITKYLPSTVKNAKHPRAVDLKKRVEGFLADHDGSLREIFIPEDGVAVLDIAGDAAAKLLADEIKKLEQVEVTEVSGFDMQLQQNRAQEEKVQKKRAKKDAKKTAA
jgi:hypothetical protein